MANFQSRVLQSLLFGLTNLNRAGFKLLLRRDNFAPVGVVTVKRVEVDSATMMPRTWAEGVRLEEDALEKGKFFKEPLDRFDSATGAFESVVLCENPYGIVLTARRSASLDDDDDGFMWLDNPFEVSEMMRIKKEIDKKNRTISSLTKDMESMKQELDFWRDAAEASGAEARDLRGRLGTLQRKVYLLQAQMDYYKLEAMVSEGLNVQVESAVRKILASAKERGMEFAATDAERTLTSIENLKKQKEKIAALVPSGALTEDELRKIRAEIGEMRKTLESLARTGKAETPKPPETPTEVTR